jgi:hypothetical protein
MRNILEALWQQRRVLNEQHRDLDSGDGFPVCRKSAVSGHRRYPREARMSLSLSRRLLMAAPAGLLALPGAAPEASLMPESESRVLLAW